MSPSRVAKSSAFTALRAGVVLALTLAVVGACEKAAAPAPAPTAPQAGPGQPLAPKKPSADFSGVVRGIVKLAPGATLPTLPQPKTPPVNATAPCRPFAQDDLRVVSQSADTQGLSPIHIAITQMTAVPETKPTTRDVFIRGCRLTPGVVGAMVGDEIRVLNESDVPLVPRLPGDSFMKGLLKGESRTIKVARFGPAQITCGLGGYCGQSMVIAVAHPLFAVTDGRGEFVIRGVPLDQDITVHAGHMLFAVASQKTRLSKAEPEKTIELVLTPNAPGAVPFREPAPAKPVAPAGEKGAPKQAAPGAAAPKDAAPKAAPSPSK
jgi:hypothetical protein